MAFFLARLKQHISDKVCLLLRWIPKPGFSSSHPPLLSCSSEQAWTESRKPISCLEAHWARGPLLKIVAGIRDPPRNRQWSKATTSRLRVASLSVPCWRRWPSLGRDCTPSQRGSRAATPRVRRPVRCNECRSPAETGLTGTWMNGWTTTPPFYMAWRRVGGGSLHTAVDQRVREHRENTKIGLQEAAVKHRPFAGMQTVPLSRCGGHKVSKAGPGYQTEPD